MEPTQATSNQPKRAGKPAGSVTQQQQQRLEGLERLKALITEESGRCEGGLIQTALFKQFAASQMEVPESRIVGYLSDLVKARFCEFVKLEWQGASCIKLIVELTFEQKLDAGLEALRAIKKKRQRQALTIEIAERLGITKKAAQNVVLSPLLAAGAYRTEKDGPKFKLVFVQDGPLTPEQLVLVHEWRRKSRIRPAKPAVDPAAAYAIAMEREVAAALVAPPVVVPAQLPATSDQITALISALVEANDTQAASIAHLQEALAHQIDVNSSLERRMAELGVKLDEASIMLEAERLRAQAPPPAEPDITEVIPGDLLQRALAIANVTKDSSSG